jgi:uncharacterized protein YcaQ
MPMEILSQDAVRGLMIATQGLHDAPQLPITKQSVLKMIRQIHMLQIDSINVVARAPYFVLWSRLGDYEPNWLDELLVEGKIFEFWANANCFLPIEDYPLHLAGNWYMDWKNPQEWLEEHPEVVERVMDHIIDTGSARGTDFVRVDGQKTTWENPKEEQIALDYLVCVGKLMVRERHNFQRVYDLRERVYPDTDKLPTVSREDATDQFVLYTIQALGVAKEEWISAYFRIKKAQITAALKRLKKQGRVMMVEVEGWAKPGYIHPDNLNLVEAAAAGNIPHSKTTFLSPFDPLVRDRDRTLDVFDFDFPIEFYFPAAKRKYGYFSLPILYNNALVGRLDPKAHRKEGIFEVKALHLEPGVVLDDALITAVQDTLRACAEWHQTPEIIIRDTTEPGLADVFRVE